MLNLSKRRATKMIKRLGKGLFENDGVACDYFYEPCEYDASTHITDDGLADEVRIGLVNIQNTPFTRPVSDENFVRVVLNMYHEKMHCIQKNVLFKEENLDEHTEKQLIQEIACRDNPEYYKDNGNYVVNTNEIQAEKYGIENAYIYLCQNFGEEHKQEFENILVNIVNEKKKDSYFIKSSQDFKTLDEIYDAFDKAYDDAHVESDVPKRVYIIDSKNPQDAVKKYMQNCEEAREVYTFSNDPLWKDRCVAAINLKLHPEWLEQYPALQHIDLSYENVITKPYREMKEREERALHVKEEEIDGIVNGKVNVEPVKVPEKKHYDEKALEGLSRAEKAEMMFGHLMEDSEQKSECEKD